MRKKHQSIRKAAVLLASLDEDSAALLLRQMSVRQRELLRAETERMGPLDPREQEEVIEEFFRIGPLLPAKQPSGIELDGNLPRHLSVSPRWEPYASESPAARGGPPFRYLHEASAEALIPFLEREHPQTVAVVVSRLPSRRAAEVLAGLPADLQTDVARRLVDLEETDPEILWEVERGLETWLCEQVRDDRRRTAGVSALANILGAASPQAKQHILSNLAARDRQLAGRLDPRPRRAWTFSQLEQLDTGSLQAILQRADPQILVLAMAGATREFAERALTLFPPTQAQALRRALVHLGATRLSDVEEAQRELAALADQLESRDEIADDPQAHLSIAV